MSAYFCIIGSGKCGTTTMFHVLCSHPHIAGSRIKETNFFAWDEEYEKGVTWYESLFDVTSETRICGEASPSYTTRQHGEKACRRLHAYAPDARLIYMVRDPLKRLVSIYRQHHDKGYKLGWHLPLSLEQAFEEFPQMLDSTRYWERLSTYRRFFADEQILVLFMEDLCRDPLGVYRRAFEFLGVDPDLHEIPVDAHHNRAEEKRYDTALMRLFWTTQPYKGIWYRMPHGVRKRMLESSFLRKPFKKTEWPPDERARVVETLRHDVQHILAYAGKPADFWGAEYQEPTAITRK